MGKYRSVMLLGVAVVIALMTSLFVYGYMKKNGRSQEVAVEIEPVVVAAVDLSWGTRITNEMVKKTNFLKGSLTTGYFSDPALVVGRVLIYPVKVNEPLFESRLAPVEEKTGGVAAVISPKKRAVAVKVDKVIGVSGFIHPGNRVDVLMTLATGRTFNPVTKTILENILVLAVGSETKERKGLEEKSSPTDVITLEVTPEEAEKLALATTEGRLQLALRNFGDTESVATHGTTVSTLVGSYSSNPPKEIGPPVRPPVRREVEIQKPVSPVPQVTPPLTENKVENPKPPTHTVELIKGSKVSEVKFEGSE
jgi:pilus assembly protein CpaB